jgi:hypothetical protein
MQDDAIEIESNIMASGKLKTKVDMGVREPIRLKEQGGPSSSGKNTQEEKMDAMAKIIKYLSNKISRMEIEKFKHDPYIRNKNQFRINLNKNPQIQQRKIKNEEQKIQVPFKTRNLIQGDDVQYYAGLDEDINNFSDGDIEPHLTQQDYKKYLNLGSLFDEKNINNLGDTTSQYKDLVDSIMDEIHNKYDLRPTDKTS